MRMQKGNSAILLLLFFLVVGGIVIVVNTNKNLSSMPGKAAVPTQEPSLVSKLFKTTEEVDQHNPDGTMKLIMHTEWQTDGSTIYTFFTSDIDGGNKKLIYTKTEPKDMSMAIHHNSFSPDNKLVLLEEHNGNAVSYFVLKVSGDPFANDQLLDIVNLYQERKIQYRFDDVTGWAGPTLAIVRTKKEDSTRGPAYWFVTDSRAFLQLAR